MKIPRKIKDILLGEKYHQLATSTKDGMPNLNTFGAKYLLDDETIVIIDNYMRKTIKNVLVNPNVAILIRRDKESYQIKGTCKYHNSGPEYKKAKAKLKLEKYKYPAKGILVIKTTHFYNSIAGPKAGKKFHQKRSET